MNKLNSGPTKGRQRRQSSNTFEDSRTTHGKTASLDAPYSTNYQRRQRREKHSHQLESLNLPREGAPVRRKVRNSMNRAAGTRISEEIEDDEEENDDEYPYRSNSAERHVNSSLMKCNSPFLDAIFGASEYKKGGLSQSSQWDRQRLAYDILSEPVNIRSTTKGRASPTPSNVASYTTTIETQSDISSISEMISNLGQSDSGYPTAGISRNADIDKDGGRRNISRRTADKNSLDFRSPNSLTRIIAPNVEKLPAHSVVEILLQGEEVVSVMCSVDTLKMRSEYFYEQLSALEHKNDEQSAIGISPLIIDDPSPYEAAAYLESMHDGGKAMPGRGAWSYHFARLSVQWRVEDLIAESASSLDKFMDKILRTIEQSHWRTNPSVLAGRNIALLPQNGHQEGDKPCFITGVAMESFQRSLIDNSTPDVTMRVRVESSLPPSPRPRPSSVKDASAGAYPINTNFTTTKDSLRTKSGVGVKTADGGGSNPAITAVSWQDFETIVTAEEEFVIDCDMKVLIKHKDEWIDADNHFSEEIKSSLSSSDGVCFWEMLKAMVEMPSLQLQCKGRVQNPQQIVDTLVRKEFHVLWSYQSGKKLPGFLPKKYALQLVQHAFCS